VQQFRGGLVFEAHRLLYHSTLGLRAIKKKHAWTAAWRARCGTEEGSYLRLIDSCITQFKAHGPSRTCNESNKEEEERIPGQRPGERAAAYPCASARSRRPVVLRACVQRALLHTDTIARSRGLKSGILPTSLSQSLAIPIFSKNHDVEREREGGGWWGGGGRERIYAAR